MAKEFAGATVSRRSQAVKKFRIGLHNYALRPRTTVRLVSQMSERAFRTDKLVVKVRPLDAKVTVNDVRTGMPSASSAIQAGTSLVLPHLQPPLPLARFSEAARRADSPIISIEVKRGAEISVIVTSTDTREVSISAWVEQLEAEDLS